MSSETLPVQCELSVMGVGWACRLHYEKTGKWPTAIVCREDGQDLAAVVNKELNMGMQIGFLRDFPKGFWFISSDEYVVFGHHGW